MGSQTKENASRPFNLREQGEIIAGCLNSFFSLSASQLYSDQTGGIDCRAGTI